MKKYIAEAVGTAVLTFLACGVAVTTGGSIVPTSLAFGLVIIAMAFSIGSVSGCHINPAVSLGMFVAGKMKADELWKYVVAQFIGALVGSILLGACLGSFESLGANMYGDAENIFKALLVETTLTFIFVTVILGVTEKKENALVAAFVIGLTLTLVHLFGIPFTGTSVNPARSFAPALMQVFDCADSLIQVWLFLLAPCAGGALAGLYYKFVLKTTK